MLFRLFFIYLRHVRTNIDRYLFQMLLLRLILKLIVMANRIELNTDLQIEFFLGRNRLLVEIRVEFSKKSFLCLFFLL